MEENNFIKSRGRQIGGSIGFALGVAYAFKTKSGFWKGWGYAIIGGIALGGIGYALDSGRKDSQNASELDS